MPDPDITLKDPSPRVDREWLLRLAGDLQRTLDLNELLHAFSRRAGDAVRHDRAVFESRDGQTEVSVGLPARHRCSYDVVLPDQDLGTLTFERDTPFGPEEMRILEDLTLHLVYPLRNASMYQEVLQASGRDALTGLGNRTTLEATLGREFAAANRHGEALSIIMLDVDHFKTVNDQYGHLVGDEVLRRLADLITDEIRDCDIAFRYGGEEFLIVLAKTDLTGAILLAERVRKRAQNTNIDVDEGSVNVSISLGVTTLEQGDTQATLIGRADTALYESKTAGRNRVTSRTVLDDETSTEIADPSPQSARA